MNSKILKYQATLIVFAILFILNNYAVEAQSFKENQLKVNKVRKVYKEKEGDVKALFASKNVNYPAFDLFFRAFKKEEIMEIWVKNKADKKYVKLKEYCFCTSSGVLGPKRIEGDYQIPEGFYFIDKFNPLSAYDLSMRVSYPNASDRILSDKKRPGGEIYIHGACCTIGCIPFDINIREMYIMAIEATNSGQTKIPVHIFPAKLTASNFADLKQSLKTKPELISFWENLIPGFTYFEKNAMIPKIKVLKNGKYELEE